MASITISDTSPRVQYTATNGQTAFSVAFEFFSATDLKVIHTNSSGTDATLTYASSPSSANLWPGLKRMDEGTTPGPCLINNLRNARYQTSSESWLASVVDSFPDPIKVMVSSLYQVDMLQTF